MNCTAYISLLLMAVCLLGTANAFAPTEKLLRKAYCACRCCNLESADACYKHPTVTSECTEEDYAICEGDFCEKWHQQKCVSDCFCKKCKATLPKSQTYKCQFFNEVPEECTCDDEEEIKCPDDTDEEDEMESVLPGGGDMDLLSLKKQEMLMKKEEWKAKKACIVPCFCKGCAESVPSDLQDICEALSTDFPSECTCEDEGITCEKQLDAARFNVLKAVASDPEKQKAYKKKLEAEMLSGEDKEGVSMERKCHLKCKCEKCASESPFMQKPCQDLESENDLSTCPACADDIICPTQQAKDANMQEMKCKMKCLCEACGDELWKIVPQLEEQCQLMKDLPTDSCDCKDAECPYNEETIQQEKQELFSKHDEVKAKMGEEVAKIKADFEEKKKNLEKQSEELKKAGGSGKKDHVTEVKCKFQCLCDKCKNLNAAVVKLCNEQPRVDNCGECDKNLQCPKPASNDESKHNACTMICLCQECKDHRDMKGPLKDTCKKIVGLLGKSDVVKCDCDVVDVDCSNITKMKKKLKMLEEAKDNGSTDKTGKIKQKVKLWDEL